MPRKAPLKTAAIGFDQGEMTIRPKSRGSRGSIVLTKSLMYFASMDAAKKNMRNAGRTAMNEEDNDKFFEVYDRLLEFAGGTEGWINLPD